MLLLGCALSFALALLSKEIAVLLPLLAVTLSLARPARPQLTPGHWVTLLAIAASTLVWLAVRDRIVVGGAPQYQFEFGGNMLRNAASLSAFFLNTPREAIRFALEQEWRAVLWGGSCLLLQVAAVWQLWCAARARIGSRQRLALVAFAIAACGPYFLLAWNCYAYYVALSLLAFAILAALAADNRHRLLSAAKLAFASSVLATGGNHFLDYPSLLGRANWGERQLTNLEQI